MAGSERTSTIWIERAEAHPEPTHGPRLAVKANIAVAGFDRSAACPVFVGDRQPADASVVASLRAAGAEVVGTTNMHELAFGITGNNAAFGPTAVPGHPDRSAGGSSGGSAAAVAAGEADLALGTDTGGSISIPASLCGVFGLRPTTGRWPLDGLLGLSWTRDTPGVFARTLDDIARVDAIVTGSVRRPDAFGAPDAVGASERSGFGNTPSRRPRIGLPSVLLADLAAHTRSTVDAALARLGDAADLVLVDDAAPWETALAAEMPVVLWEAPRLLGHAAAAHLGLPPVEAFRALVEGVASPDVRTILEARLADPVHPDRYAAAQRDVARARASYADLVERLELDALAFPATPAPAPAIGTDADVEHLGTRVSPFALYTRNTGPNTIIGAPMLTCPLPVGDDALPVGLTLQGARWHDRELLALAARLESTLLARPEHGAS